MRKLRENLLVQFSVISFAVMAVIAVVLAIVLSNKIRSDAIDEQVNEAVGASRGRLLSVITPADLEVPMTGERYDRFNQFVQQSIVSDRTARVKIWAKDGTVIYANDPAGVGEKFPAKPGLLAALRGENAIEIKIPNEPDNEREKFLGTLMEVYTPIIFPGASEPQGSFEVYQYYAPTVARINSLRGWLFGVISFGFVVLYGGLVSIVWGGWRTIVRQRSRLESFNTELEEQVQERTTELRAAQEGLVRSERLAIIGQLSAGVAHDLRNPLGAINNAVYYLRRRLGASEVAQSNPKIGQFLQVIEDEVQHSNRIITDLLDFARISPPSLSPTNLGETILDMLSSIEVRNNVLIVKQFEPELQEVLADPEQIRRVFMNLTMNAQEAMPDGGELTISTRMVNGFAEVAFSDTGIGIPDENLKKVFDPLFTTKPKGTGLGLAVCQETVTRHRGTIGVASKRGEGSTFTVRLPRQPLVEPGADPRVRVAQVIQSPDIGYGKDGKNGAGQGGGHEFQIRKGIRGNRDDR
jgi:signal transduction histidine kinase